MGRSSWKTPHTILNLIKNKKNIWQKNCLIPFFLIESNIKAYNGKELKSIIVKKEKIGYKIGEFVATRKPNIYKGKKKILKKK